MRRFADRVRQFAAIVLFSAVAAIGLAPSPLSADVDPSRIETHRSKSAPLVYHYPGRYRPAIDKLDKSSAETVEGLTTQLGLEEFPEVDVWLMPEVADYFEVNDLENRAPEWAIGLSLGDRHTVVVARDTSLPGAAETDLEKTFVHELAHVAVEIAQGDGEVPRWFNEGFALIHAREWTPQRSERLAQAASTGSLIALSELDKGFPSHRNVASLAYSQSFHFVRYLQERFGPTVTADIMRRVRSGTPFETAIEEATDYSLAALETEWRNAITQNTSWLALLRDDFTIFFGATLLFVLAWIVVRRRRRRQREEAADEEDGEWSYDESRYPLPGEPRER